MRLSPEEMVNLVQQAQAGDEAAYEALVRAFFDSVHYYVGRFTSNHDLREEILQQIWITVYFSLNRLRHPEAFITWLFRIAHHKTMSELKLNKKLGSRFPISLDDLPTDVEEEPDDDFSEAEIHLIHRGLLELSPEHREVLILRFMEDLDYTKIAGITNVSLGTVRSRIHYAKIALRKVIEKLRLEDHV